MAEPNIEELGQAFEALKTANDEAQKEYLKKGEVDTILQDKLSKINKSLDEFENTNQKLTKSLEEQKSAIEAAEEESKKKQEQVDRLETALKRAPRSRSEEKQAKYEEHKETFFKFVRRGREGLDPDEMKSLSVSDDTTGGYLAPPEYVREIIKGELEFSPVRSIVRVRTTGQRSLQQPKRTGQFAAVWVAEQGTRAETAGLTWGLEEIPTHELYALVDISEQNLEDSLFDLESELNDEFTEQFGVAEGTAFVNGNAVGKPEGFMTNSDIAETVSGSAAVIADSAGQANGLMDLYHGLKTVYAVQAVWTLNRTTLGAVRKLKDADNNYIWMPGLASGIPNTILGQPYVEMTDMPDEGANLFPIAFGNFRRCYTIVDRISMSILRDPFTQAASGNIRFIARRRTGGQVVLPEAVRKLKCSV